MEVNVEAVEGLPPKCFIGIRMGGVQKQAPYDPKTLYRFPDLKRNGKVDVFQRIGSCDLSWSCEDRETRVCKPTDLNRCDIGMKLKVTMTRLGVAALKNSEAAEKTAAKTAKAEHTAKSAKYISERGVEEMLTSAMRALLKTMPEDAPEFLCNFIDTNYGSGRRKMPQVAGANSTKVPSKVGTAEYYRQHVLPSCQDYFSRFHSRSRWQERPQGKPLEPLNRSGEAFSSCGTIDSASAKLLKEYRMDLAQQLVSAMQGGELESAVMRLASQADQSSGLGSLEEFLECFKQKKAEAEEEQLRARARTTLIDAAKSGNLRGVLTELFTDERKVSELENLRGHMSKVLVESALDGSLEELMSKSDNATVSKPGKASDVSDHRARLRQDLKQTMVEAAQDGRLLDALVEKNQNQDHRARLRQDLKQTMVEAAQDGRLLNALVEKNQNEAKTGSDVIENLNCSIVGQEVMPTVQAETLNDLRTKLNQSLMVAARDGTLHDALSQNSKRQTLNELQQDLKMIMLSACDDGSLQNTLAQRSEKHVDSKQLPSKEQSLLSSGMIKQCVAAVEDDFREKLIRDFMTSSMNGSLQDVVQKLAAESGIAPMIAPATVSSVTPNQIPQVAGSLEDLSVPSYLIRECVAAVRDEVRIKAGRELLKGSTNGSLYAAIQNLIGGGNQAFELPAPVNEPPPRISSDTPQSGIHMPLSSLQSEVDVDMCRQISGEIEQEAELIASMKAVDNSLRSLSLSEGLGSAPAEQKIWKVRPSVGTWLRPRRKRKPHDNF